METAFLIACALLMVGFLLRAKLRLFQWLFIPASVLGGAVGLALVSSGAISHSVVIELKTWPGWLISVVFACLLLERSGKNFGESVRGAARQGIYVWIVVVGQIAIGLLATALFVLPFRDDVPVFFGQLIEAGFAGGHGTAAALGAVYDQSLGFKEGADLAVLFATVGLVFGVVSGIVYVNLAVRRGWTRDGDAEVVVFSGLEARESPSPMALARVRAEAIDPFVFQVLIVAAAFAVGIGLQKLLLVGLSVVAGWAGYAQQYQEASRYIDNLPPFMFALIGGWLVREFLFLIKAGDLIDGDSIRRIAGAAMEFLIVAAMTSLNLEAIIQFGAPIAILLVLGFAWTGFCLLFIARRLLPKEYWFELGIINYGMSTATTAQGMMLLRIIDKDLDSGAAEDYALGAPLSAPFIGGGIITVVLPALLQIVHVGFVIAGLLVLMAGLWAAGTSMAND